MYINAIWFLVFDSIIPYKQPRQLYLLMGIQLLESFSHFAVSLLLVLYIVKGLNYSDREAFTILAVYMGLVEGLAILGGHVADKFFGLYRSIYIGAIIMLTGYIVLVFQSIHAMYLGLAASAVGSSLFRTSTIGLLGESYGEGDLRRDAGFTYFYVSINIGIFLALFFGGYVSSAYGWHYVFMLSAMGMICCMALLYKFKHILPTQDDEIQSINIAKALLMFIAAIFATYLLLYYNAITIYFLGIFAIGALFMIYMIARKQDPKHQRMLNVLIASVLLFALFYSFEEQVALSLGVFSDRFVNHEFLGFNTNPVSLLSFNPIAVIILGPVIGLIIELYEFKQHHETNLFIRMGLGFFLMGLAFVILYLASYNHEYTAAEIMAFTLVLIGIAELCIDPAVYAYASEAAPKHMHALIMGAVMSGFSIAGLGSGFVASIMTLSKSENPSINDYALGFMNVGYICLSITLMIIIAKVTQILIRAYKSR